MNGFIRCDVHHDDDYPIDQFNRTRASREFSSVFINLRFGDDILFFLIRLREFDVKRDERERKRERERFAFFVRDNDDNCCSACVGGCNIPLCPPNNSCNHNELCNARII
ncbi:hypothetical protein DERP_012259 [Dermatophagoides pteronyssinus]|uniref:Uncharacterized protein n=1 Tax=Dermatophagoides pteronyssinus TaxID=6956 RepID=A0ABQ8JGT2_DERPT|nr:hypothetical protein DERP_012259 [Dermatophagoides pteronyssinus]